MNKFPRRKSKSPLLRGKGRFRIDKNTKNFTTFRGEERLKLDNGDDQWHFVVFTEARGWLGKRKIRSGLKSWQFDIWTLVDEQFPTLAFEQCITLAPKQFLKKTNAIILAEMVCIEKKIEITLKQIQHLHLQPFACISLPMFLLGILYACVCVGLLCVHIGLPCVSLCLCWPSQDSMFAP